MGPRRGAGLPRESAGDYALRQRRGEAPKCTVTKIIEMDVDVDIDANISHIDPDRD